MYLGEDIAVKKLHALQGLNDEPFDNEVLTLSQIHHPNVVHLIGYCHQSNINFVKHNNQTIRATVMERILCYKYMPGGSLEKHIKGICVLHFNYTGMYIIIRIYI